jgi:hypothetical protein
MIKGNTERKSAVTAVTALFWFRLRIPSGSVKTEPARIIKNVSAHLRFVPAVRKKSKFKYTYFIFLLPAERGKSLKLQC